MLINGTNVDTFGVIVGDRTPSRSAATTAQIIAGAPGAWRRIRLGRGAPEALRINVVGAIYGADLSTLQSNIDRFKWELRPDREFILSWSDTSGREWHGYRQSLRIDDITPGWVSTGVFFTLEIICPDPYARNTTLEVDQTSGSLPLVLTPDVGTAPMPVIITLTGNTTITNPVFHYRDGVNQDIVTLGYTGTLTSGQSLVIDTELFTAEKQGANVGGDMSGSYFDVNPGDGDYLGSPNAPDVQVTASGGIASAYKLEYKPRWW